MADKYAVLCRILLLAASFQGYYIKAQITTMESTDPVESIVGEE